MALSDEAFHRVVTEFLDEWASVHRPGFVALRVVGEMVGPIARDQRPVVAQQGAARVS